MGLWCQNYHGAVERNGGCSHFLSRKSKVLRFRLQDDFAALVIDVPTRPNLRGNYYSSHKSRLSGVDGNGRL